jgi:aryl-alcohol dehydrogenase-like predicted oxidoreductase
MPTYTVFHFTKYLTDMIFSMRDTSDVSFYDAIYRNLSRKIKKNRPMKKYKLGNSSLQVSPLCFGGNVFGWTIPEKTSFELLDQFAERGFNFIDTADVYSYWVRGNKGGESETIIGKWMKLKRNRKKMIIATKVGMKLGEGREGLSRKWMRQAVEDSLKRLQTDYIDLYQSHVDDLNTPQEETLSVYADLIQEGKVRYIGASNFTAARLKSALDISEKENLPAYQTLQPLYNLYDRAGFEKELEPLCVEKNIAVITYFSLASGFLTGKYKNKEDLGKSQRGGRVEKYMDARGMRILRALSDVAKRHHWPQAAIALAWLLQRPGVVAPIASATSAKQLKDLMKVIDIGLSPADLEALELAGGE